MHTETVEDYLKTIFELDTRNGGATTSTLAERLDVAAPTVSAMLKRLQGDDLVARPGAHRVALTEHGTAHALAVVRRHRFDRGVPGQGARPALGGRARRGRGAITQVIIAIAPGLRDGAGRLLGPAVVGGLAVGVSVMYLTGLLVTV